MIHADRFPLRRRVLALRVAAATGVLPWQFQLTLQSWPSQSSTLPKMPASN
ncbi:MULTISPECIES: hypothetical protein [Corynebacterium]|uniref:Uncharacterized protein n=1 Tax=Corynebacterium striatum TaxID=43770 RepID=A0ABX7DEM8_CORST|nr:MULTISPECIES: hypothetical protein [Corynebacterium]MDC7105157.1 hypothetical protein [Corynebacterium striatum]MDK8824725.1 hypothetical protein [Corynebacterium striatum]MDK8832385.1 hypothetical protein [Corynebacterium striatum]MDK8876138.1 hypothetical protein [Corynebacterium striatum]QQU76733.1 hypothetical protein I6I72_11795 [Corynebacterium striatum]